MARTVKCQYKKCGKAHDFELRNNLKKIEKKSEETGRTKNLYYCDECYQLELVEEEFRKVELAQKDVLNDVIKGIYGIPKNVNIPKVLWNYIQDVRNGTERNVKGFKKKSKKGVSYLVIAEAYRMSKSEIEWASLNKNFKLLEQEMRYGFAIVCNRIADADRKIRRTEMQDKASKELDKVRYDMQSDNREVVYKKKENKNDDLTYLLGED